MLCRGSERAPAAALVVVAVLASGCMGREVGAECRRSGDGFLARDPCRTICLAFPMPCPGREAVTPNVCAGREGCTPGDCPEGQVCVHLNVDRTFCVPAAICPGWS